METAEVQAPMCKTKQYLLVFGGLYNGMDAFSLWLYRSKGAEKSHTWVIMEFLTKANY